MDDDDEDHHSDDSCLLHEFTSPACSRAVSPTRSRAATRHKANPCCSTSTCLPCPILTSSRPLTRLGNFDDLSSRIDSLRRELRSGSSPRSGSRSAGAAATTDDSITCCCLKWQVSLLRSLRRDPNSLPERRSDGRTGTRIRQPGRTDVGFTPRKGDLIIHHAKKPGRKVLEFYDPICQRLHDGDILVRFKIDSYACEGIVLVKGSGYVYHRGFWVYLGKDSDQIARSFNW